VPADDDTSSAVRGLDSPMTFAESASGERRVHQPHPHGRASVLHALQSLSVFGCDRGGRDLRRASA
jgi:hypothetical protein